MENVARSIRSAHQVKRHWFCVAVAILGLGQWAMLPQAAAQPREEAAPALLDGYFAAAIPKTMQGNASTLIKVAIWTKRADAEARATLGAGALAAANVRIGRRLKVELAGMSQANFSVRAMTPATQLLPESGMVLWEWTVVPLQAGAHEFSVVATHLADAPGDASGAPLNQAVRSLPVKVEVAAGAGAKKVEVAAGAKKVEVAAGTKAEPQPGKAAATTPPQNLVPGDKLDGKAMESKFAAFFKRLKRALKQQWHPEALVSWQEPTDHIMGGNERKTVLKVELRPDGYISNLAVSVASGNDFFDDEAVNAFRRAQPFEDPPSALVDSEGLIRFRFGFILYDRESKLEIE